MIPEKLGTQIERRSKVLISLEDRIFGGIAQAYHTLKALDLCAHHIVGFDTEMLQDIENHRSSCGLAMTAPHHDTNLILGLLIKVLRK